MKTKAIFTTVIIGCLSLLALAQKATVRATIEPSEIKVGQQAKLTLQASHDDRTAIIWPAITENIGSKIELVKQGKIDTTFTEDKKNISYKQDLLVTSFDSGVFTIPPFSFMYFSGNDTITIFTDSLLLYSATVPVDTLKGFKDITNPLEVPLIIEELVPYILLFLIIIGLGIGLYFWIQKRRKKQPEVKFEPIVVEPAHIIALRELEALKAKRLWQQGQVKNYYIELTDIIRRYLHLRFSIDATEMTTEEILHALRLTDCSSESITAITRLLRLADLVKFAKAQPLENEHEEAYKQAFIFIEITALKGNETT
ncbi:MAG: hypothetical protein N2167_08155 [Flavobacteriales bacterium]|nr:hypothetical protein [Flavobacteriales bacterium]